jgi:putative nucleotidyltransferase with HDIG domain
MVRCPGQDQRFWKPEDIFEVSCPGCNIPIEFFKDEPKLKCRNCGQAVANPKIDLGCAEWCQYAEQCLAVSASNEANIMQERLIREMKNVFGTDQRRIDHALAVLDYAEQIVSAEGGDPLVVKAAAILHDIGISEAERKHGSSSAKYQEIEGPPIAREILSKYDLDEAIVEHICKIIANHHSAKDIDTAEFRIVWDADWLVNIPADYADAGDEELRKLINKVIKTGTGRQIAEKLFLEKQNLQNQK